MIGWRSRFGATPDAAIPAPLALVSVARPSCIAVSSSARPASMASNASRSLTSAHVSVHDMERDAASHVESRMATHPDSDMFNLP
ncbi:hypothetical protein DAEQUDRAFT_733118 [Daedalea quercina L-15889]|uniref:Uncharacterized protein n=1 Tax=Daedalea quercina L-15889 TaxID=1314783 RepID=A0A165L7V8_9APHY|nr:hypothetical protein DAEQUDRAFT_733118 [Daedalea quercina L-15889]